MMSTVSALDTLMSVGEVTFSKCKTSDVLLPVPARCASTSQSSSVTLEVCTRWPASPHAIALTAIALLSAL